jgi:hypothetical protein
VLDQLAVLVVGVGALAEQLDPFGQVGDDRGPDSRVEVLGVEGPGQDIPNLPRGAPSPGRQVGDQLITASTQMGQTTLMSGLFVLAVGGSAVSDQGAGKVALVTHPWVL